MFCSDVSVPGVVANTLFPNIPNIIYIIVTIKIETHIFFLIFIFTTSYVQFSTIYQVNYINNDTKSQ